MIPGVDVNVRQLLPIDVWREKDNMAKRERDSLEFWQRISEDSRSAISLVVKDALIRLANDPLRWVPMSIDPTKGDRLDITITVQLPELTAEELAHKVDMTRIRDENLKGLLRILQETADPPING